MNHAKRLQSLINDAKSKGAKVEFGGVCDVEQRFVSPTLLTNVDVQCNLMQEEIFGPILPIVPYDSLEEAIEFVTSRPHPLALYVFTDDKKVEKRVIAETTSGGVCVNDCLMHYGNKELPFGGVGASGMYV